MLSGPVAAAHKEMTAHQAAPVAHATAASLFDFSQLVAGAQPVVNTAATGTTPSTDTAPSAAPKAKERHDKAGATDAATAAAQAPQAPQPIPPQSVPLPPAATAAAAAPSSAQTLANAASGSAAAAAVAAATRPATPVPPAPGTSAQNAAGDAANQNGQTTPLPLGATDLAARVAIAAQNYLSQPSAVLAGLWHHGGEPGTATPQAQSSQDQGNSASTAGADNQAPGQAGPDAKTVAALAPATAAANATLVGASVAAAKPDTAAATAAAPSADATASAAQIFTLPGTSGVQTAAMAPGAPAAPPTAPHILPAYEQVAVNLKQAAQNGTDHIEIQLKPASLGAIAVKLDVTHDGRITAVISADRSDTLHMLRQDSAGLQQALRDAGLQADSGSLSFNLRGDAQSFAQNSHNPAPAQTDSSAAEPVQLATSHTAAARPRRHDGALDIEV